MIRSTSLFALALLAATASAQDGFNIDVGSVLATPPSSSYGAGAGQPGVWNRMTDGTEFQLVNLAGERTSVTISALGANFAFWSNNPGTSGDDELLMDDLCDGGRIYTIDGLVNGDYVIYTYAWAPDVASFLTNVSIPASSDPDQLIGGSWPGGQQQGITYARHQVTVTGGPILIDIDPGQAVGASSVNGFQIVNLSLCPNPAAYCTAGTTTNGCVPAIGSTGTPSISQLFGFDIVVDNVEGQKLGILFYGISGRTGSPWGMGNSFLCVKAPTQRTPVTASGGTSGACDGVLSLDWTAYRVANPSALGQPFAAGNTVWSQGWFRDPPSPKTTNLSDGLEFTVCP